MNKLEIQKRVTINGEPISLDQFTWGETSYIFVCYTDYITVDFSGLNSIVMDVGRAFIEVGDNCTIDTVGGSKVKAGEHCVIIRRDNNLFFNGRFMDVIKPETGQIIQLNDLGEKGYKIIKEPKTITLDGKEFEISEESFKAFKKQFTEG